MTVLGVVYNRSQSAGNAIKNSQVVFLVFVIFLISCIHILEKYLAQTGLGEVADRGLLHLHLIIVPLAH